MVFSPGEAGWISEPMIGLHAVLRMPEIGIDVPMAEIYDGVGLSSVDDASPGEALTAARPGTQLPGSSREDSR